MASIVAVSLENLYDELVSDALRTALATQTAVPSAAVVEARAAGAEVVAAALNGLNAA